MARIRSAGTARIAVVGASSPDGSRIREALSRAGVPGARVALYGETGGEAVLSEYADEARLIQEVDLDEIAGREVVFLCEAGASAAAVRTLVAPDPGPAGRTLRRLECQCSDPLLARYPLRHAQAQPR